MTLLSTIYLAKNSLFASQAGIQVAANNIANTDTPGYVREKLILAPAPTQRLGKLVMGSGVEVQGVVREVDSYLQERLRAAGSDMANGEMLEKIFIDLESAIGELTDGDLSTALTDFFNSLNDVLNQPEDPAVRKLAVLSGESLAGQIRHLDARVRELREMTNSRIVTAAQDINQLVKEIAKLNKQIIEVEQGGAIVSDAVGLRDKRDKALEDLAKIIDIQVDEQATGAVNVFVGGDYLVFDGTTQLVEAVPELDRGLPAVQLHLSKSDAQLRATSGELAGLLTARDDILAGFLDELDAFTGSLIFEFNKIHASGQGLSGYDAILSEHRVDDASLPLDVAGLDFTPVHGSLQVQILNKETGIQQTYDIFVQLSGLSDDTSLTSLASELDGIDGLAAEVTIHGQLSLRSESPELAFSLANDSSGTLAALGINTFFIGTRAADIRVHETLKADAGKLAVSRDGVGHDTRNGELLADMLTTPLESRDGASLAQVYEGWMGETAQSSSLAAAVAEGYRAFHATLEGEHLAISGVSLDEEAVNMMTFQRMFQASAKVISTINELLDVLVNL